MTDISPTKTLEEDDSLAFLMVRICEYHYPRNKMAFDTRDSLCTHVLVPDDVACAY